MVERRELINVFRQIGIMMQAGVDFLRITHVLRAQTENPRLAALYNDLDHDLTMGMSLADAMARQPDIFSPLAVSLVRQTEMRSEMAEMSQDLAAAFLRVADYLQQEATPARASGPYDAAGAGTATAAKPVATTAATPPIITADAPLTSASTNSGATQQETTLEAALERWSATLRLIALRGLIVFTLLCSALTALAGSVALGWLEPKWLGFAGWGVGALGAGGAALWLWQSGPAHSDSAMPVLPTVPAQPMPAATLDEPAATATGDAPPDESGAMDSASDGLLDTIHPAPGPTRGNWADLKQADESLALPAWAREAGVTSLPSLPPGAGQVFAPDQASAAAPCPDAPPCGEADYE